MDKILNFYIVQILSLNISLHYNVQKKINIFKLKTVIEEKYLFHIINSYCSIESKYFFTFISLFKSSGLIWLLSFHLFYSN